MPWRPRLQESKATHSALRRYWVVVRWPLEKGRVASGSERADTCRSRSVVPSWSSLVLRNKAPSTVDASPLVGREQVMSDAVDPGDDLIGLHADEATDRELPGER